MSQLSNEIRDLMEQVELYLDQITPKKEIRFALELIDTGEAVTIVLQKEPKIIEGSVNPDARYYMKREVFDSILAGESDIFSLIGRSKWSDKRPVEFDIINHDRAEELWEIGKALLTYFFLPGKVKVRRLTLSLAGEAHGGHPVPLVYWNGMRSAWFFLKKGELLNEEGEKDPHPQLFIIQSGSGTIIIGEEKFDIDKNLVVYVTTNTFHQIHAETDTELIMLAWKS